MFCWDAAVIARRDQRTERLKPENIKAMFNTYFPMDRYTLVTLKPESWAPETHTQVDDS